jgi:hypothetical protein
MLEAIFEHIATLLGPDPGLHSGDDMHALDPDDDIDDSW